MVNIKIIKIINNFLDEFRLTMVGLHCRPFALHLRKFQTLNNFISFVTQNLDSLSGEMGWAGSLSVLITICARHGHWPSYFKRPMIGSSWPNRFTHRAGPKYRHVDVVTPIKQRCISKTYMKILGPCNDPIPDLAKQRGSAWSSGLAALKWPSLIKW